MFNLILLNKSFKEVTTVFALLCFSLTFSAECLSVENYSCKTSLKTNELEAAVVSSAPPPLVENKAKPAFLSPKTRRSRLKSLDLCSVTEVSQLKTLPSSTLLVDVRSKLDFEAWYIPGSTNLPFFSLKTNFFMKDRRVVLIDNGFDSWQLHLQCSELKSMGFEYVSVLRGGLYTWTRANRGDTRPGLSAARIVDSAGISARSFDQMQDRLWMIINQSNLEHSALSSVLAVPVEQVFSANTPADLLEAKSHRLDKDEGEQIITDSLFLVVGSSKRVPTAFFELYESLQTGEVFYLKDGVGGYQTFVDRQDAIVRRLVARSVTKPTCSVN